MTPKECMENSKTRAMFTILAMMDIMVSEQLEGKYTLDINGVGRNFALGFDQQLAEAGQLFTGINIFENITV